MRRLIDIWKQHPVLVTGFVLALALTCLFAVRAVVFVSYWNDPDKQNQPVAGWMSPRYVAYSWDVPPEMVAQALSLPQDSSGRLITLDEIAENQNTDIAALAARLNAAILAYRASHDITND